MKEAVFSMLESRQRCAGIAVLDLFAGTGSLGIEALSRGAAAAVFVEPDRAAASAIRANLAAAGFDGEVLPMPATRAVTRLHREGRSFGGVFLDPPYDRGWVAPTLAQLARAGIVEDGGWLVVEHGPHEEAAARIGAFVRAHDRRYGDTRISLYTLETEAVRAHGGE